MQLHLILGFHKLPKSNTDAALEKIKSVILPRQVLDILKSNTNKYIWPLSLNKEVVSSMLLENVLRVGTTEVIPFFICHPVEISDMLKGSLFNVTKNDTSQAKIFRHIRPYVELLSSPLKQMVLL